MQILTRSNANGKQAVQSGTTVKTVTAHVSTGDDTPTQVQVFAFEEPPGPLEVFAESSRAAWRLPRSRQRRVPNQPTNPSEAHWYPVATRQQFRHIPHDQKPSRKAIRQARGASGATTR